MTTQQYHQEISEMIEELNRLKEKILTEELTEPFDINEDIMLYKIQGGLKTALTFCEDDLKRCDEDIEFFNRLLTFKDYQCDFKIHDQLGEKQSLRSEIIKRIEEIKGAIQ